MSPERLWYGVAIPIAKLDEFDNCPSPIALADAVGDRYLCMHNPLFSRIREAALRFGYRYSSADNPCWRDYLALPLITLNQIIATKVIPYHSTGNTIRRLLETNPKAALSPGFILGNLKKNFTLHEAAHCVAHAVLRNLDSGLRATTPCERERFVISAAFEESFANTVEWLGTLPEHMSIPDSVFYNLNAYISPTSESTAVLTRAGSELGERLRFSLLLLSSLEANFSGGELEDATCERIVNAIDCPRDHRDLPRKVIKIGFELNHRFREYTNPLYFELLGYQKEYTLVAKADWLADPANYGFLNDLTANLFGIATGYQTG